MSMNDDRRRGAAPLPVALEAVHRRVEGQRQEQRHQHPHEHVLRAIQITSRATATAMIVRARQHRPQPEADEALRDHPPRIAEASDGLLGGLGGTSLVLGVRWSFRGKDAGSARSSDGRAPMRTRLRAELCGFEGHRLGFVKPS